MKILHVIESLDTGGAEKLLCNTISELPNCDHLVLTLFPSNDLSLLPKGIQLVTLNSTKKAWLALKTKMYRNIIKKYQPDLVHAHLYFATVLAKAFTPSSIPVVFTQHFEFSKNATKWYYRFLDRIVSKQSHTCVAVSNAVLQDYITSTNFRGRTITIGNYIPDRYFQLNRKVREDKQLKLVSLGNIKKIKNQQYLLDAFFFLKDLPVCCDVYGDGEDRLRLEKQARDENISVYFKGPVPDSSAVLPNYDLYIMPSLTEGFPLALFEAVSIGLPPVVSDIPVFREVLDNKGSYLSLQDPKQLRPIVLEYLKFPEKLYRDGTMIKELAKGKVTKEIYLNKLITLYNSLVSARKLVN